MLLKVIFILLIIDFQKIRIEWFFYAIFEILFMLIIYSDYMFFKLYWRFNFFFIYFTMTAKLSPEQSEEFKQAFKLLDVDGDGRLTHDVTSLLSRNWKLSWSNLISTLKRKISDKLSRKSTLITQAPSNLMNFSLSLPGISTLNEPSWLEQRLGGIAEKDVLAIRQRPQRFHLKVRAQIRIEQIGRTVELEGLRIDTLISWFRRRRKHKLRLIYWTNEMQMIKWFNLWSNNNLILSYTILYYPYTLIF